MDSWSDAPESCANGGRAVAEKRESRWTWLTNMGEGYTFACTMTGRLNSAHQASTSGCGREARHVLWEHDYGRSNRSIQTILYDLGNPWHIPRGGGYSDFRPVARCLAWWVIFGRAPSASMSPCNMGFPNQVSRFVTISFPVHCLSAIQTPGTTQAFGSYIHFQRERE